MKNRRTFASLLFATFVFAFAAPPSWAEFRVCNETGQVLNVAYTVYYVRAQVPKYESRGWSVLQNKECRDVDSSGYRRVWLLGMAQDGTMWEGAVGDAKTRRFCQKSDFYFHFDEGVTADVHTEAICEREGGKLKEFREFFGQFSLHTISFDPPATPRRDKVKAPPIWETYPDDPKASASRPGPTPTFAPD